VRVVVRFDDDAGNTETLASTATGTIANVNDPATGLRLTGIIAQEQPLTADTSGITDPDGAPQDGFAFRYQWQRSTDGGNTWDDIGAETDATYTLGWDDAGHKVRVVVHFTDGAGNEEQLIGEVQAGNAKGTVTVTGKESQDEALTAAVTGVTDPDGTPQGGFVFTYQWQRGTEDDSNTPDDASDDTLAWTDITGANASTDGGGNWDDIDGADAASYASSYTLTQADVGHKVRVVVRFDDDAGNTETLASTATGTIANVNDPATGLRLTGAADLGLTLTADTSGVTDPDGAPQDGFVFTYQWQRGTEDDSNTPDDASDDTLAWTDITGANSTDGGGNWDDIDGADAASYAASSYTLTQADVGHKVRVVVRFDDDAGNTETLASTATGTIANVNDPATGLRVTGAADLGCGRWCRARPRTATVLMVRLPLPTHPPCRRRRWPT
jgi:hypothetical protein